MDKARSNPLTIVPLRIQQLSDASKSVSDMLLIFLYSKQIQE